MNILYHKSYPLFTIDDNVYVIYTVNMKKLVKKYNPFGHKVFRKTFWLFEKHKKEIRIAAKKNWGNNESALMRAIVDNWFEK